MQDDIGCRDDGRSGASSCAKIHFSWGAILAGAIAAAALAFVLDSFGLALGLAVSSASPTWRDTSFALVLLSGLYLLLVALASYGLGGCVACRMRRRSDPSELPELKTECTAW